MPISWHILDSTGTTGKTENTFTASTASYVTLVGYSGLDSTSQEISSGSPGTLIHRSTNVETLSQTASSGAFTRETYSASTQAGSTIAASSEAYTSEGDDNGAHEGTITTTVNGRRFYFSSSRATSYSFSGSLATRFSTSYYSESTSSYNESTSAIYSSSGITTASATISPPFTNYTTSTGLTTSSGFRYGTSTLARTVNVAIGVTETTVETQLSDGEYDTTTASTIGIGESTVAVTVTTRSLLASTYTTTRYETERVYSYTDARGPVAIVYEATNDEVLFPPLTLSSSASALLTGGTTRMTVSALSSSAAASFTSSVTYTVTVTGFTGTTVTAAVSAADFETTYTDVDFSARMTTSVGTLDIDSLVTSSSTTSGLAPTSTVSSATYRESATSLFYVEGTDGSIGIAAVGYTQPATLVWTASADRTFTTPSGTTGDTLIETFGTTHYNGAYEQGATKTGFSIVSASPAPPHAFDANSIGPILYTDFISTSSTTTRTASTTTGTASTTASTTVSITRQTFRVAPLLFANFIIDGGLAGDVYGCGGHNNAVVGTASFSLGCHIRFAGPQRQTRLSGEVSSSTASIYSPTAVGISGVLAAEYLTAQTGLDLRHSPNPIFNGVSSSYAYYE
jgi:hypothetical protein